MANEMTPTDSAVAVTSHTKPGRPPSCRGPGYAAGAAGRLRFWIFGATLQRHRLKYRYQRRGEETYAECADGLPDPQSVTETTTLPSVSPAVTGLSDRSLPKAFTGCIPRRRTTWTEHVTTHRRPRSVTSGVGEPIEAPIGASRFVETR